jgi:hypothetical protein
MYSTVSKRWIWILTMVYGSPILAMVVQSIMTGMAMSDEQDLDIHYATRATARLVHVFH